MTTRIGALVALAAGMVALGILVAGPARAGDDLDEYLERAAEAEFSGTQIVISQWNGESAAGLYEVSQADGVTQIERNGGMAMLMGDGKVRSATGSSEVYVSEWSEWRLADRYTTAAPEATVRLGRPAQSLSVFENGRLRFLMVFDSETGAPLLSEVFDSGGNPFRVAVMMDFTPGPGALRRSFVAAVPSEEMPRVDGIDLPASAAGYWRADVYAGPAKTKHAFYTDGLFSFSVFEVPGRSDAGSFADGSKFRRGGHTYRSLLNPGAVQLFWNTPNASYVLIGDLPPDHLESVLDELPRPGEPNVLVRVWRGLFG